MKAKKIEISAEEATELLDRVRESTLSKDDYEIIKGAVNTLILLEQAVLEKSTSVKRLLKIIFGGKTEKKKQKPKKNTAKKRKKKCKGHGKNSADDYSGAEKEEVTHTTLQHCDPCPDCDDGKIYRQATPGVVVRIKGVPPLFATIYELEKLRCNICGKVFTAILPAETGTQKYDATASAMLAVLRYGSGLPLNRIIALPACKQEWVFPLLLQRNEM
jgi:hypothetical protein